MNKETIMFKFIPTMRCNFKCEYCFVDNNVKKNGSTMFDDHSVEEWIEGMKHFNNYNVEPYFWGGEPFCIDGTYDILKEWVKMDHIISGFRIDTNIFYAEKIAKICPSDKIKLNCSYHMQYHTLEEEFEKVKLLKKLDMIAMVNFVASEYNLTHLRIDYGMTVKNLIEKFAEIGVFVNIAGDFAYANNHKYQRYTEYEAFIEQFISPEEWKWLRGVREPRKCTAGQKFFYVRNDGGIVSCQDEVPRGNFFDGTLNRDKDVQVCDWKCPSIVNYSFRCDNSFPSTNSLMAYVERNEAYRKNLNQKFKDFIF